MQPRLSSKGLVISKRERRGRRREGKEREEGGRANQVGKMKQIQIAHTL